MRFMELMPMNVVHLAPMEFLPMFRRVISAMRVCPVIAMPVVERMVHMPVEIMRPVEPGTSPNEHTTREPLWTVVPVRGTVVRRNFVVSVRTNRRRTNAYRNLGWRSQAANKKQASGRSHQSKKLQSTHLFTSVAGIAVNKTDRAPRYLQSYYNP